MTSTEQLKLQGALTLAWILFIGFIVAALCAPLVAQDYLYAVGNPTFSTTIPVENGFINISNGNLHLEFPLATHAQRGSLKLNERLVYDGRIWKIASNGSGYVWSPTNVPNSNGGWRFVSGGEIGSYTYQTGSPQQCGPYYFDDYFIEVTKRTWTDPGGTNHDFYGALTRELHGNCHAPAVADADSYAADGSGYHMVVRNYSDVSVYAKDGTQVYPTVTDTNGNYFYTDGSGNLVDTVGRTPVTKSSNGSQTYYDVLTFGGGRARYTVTYTTVNYNTAFQQQAVTEAQGSFQAIQSIGLPDGTSYIFNYDSGTTAGHYGELTSVTFPQGGTVSYGYDRFFDSYNNWNIWLKSRTSAEGTWTFSPQSETKCSNGTTGCEEWVWVVKPAGFYAVYILTLNNGAWNTKISSAGYETNIEYDFSNPCPANGCTGSQFIRKTNVTTTYSIPNGSKKSRKEYHYDSAQTGNVDMLKEYDFYTGNVPAAPTRETDFTYTSASRDKPKTQTILDSSGTQVAASSNEYDNNGNLTSVSQWLKRPDQPSGTWVTTGSFTYDSFGNRLTATDALSNPTTFSYDSKYQYAYLTKISGPHTTSGQSHTSVLHDTTYEYDFSSGLRTKAVDENNQITSYSYDSSLRPVSAVSPRGTTTYEYPDAKTIKLTNARGGITDSVTVTTLDGLGRASQRALQAGSTSWNVTTTCYNAAGLVSFQRYPTQNSSPTVISPCSGNGDSYSYDDMSRVTSVVHSDGTSQTYTPSGAAVLIKDEGGAQKVSAYDGLGRLKAVCEIATTSHMSSGPSNCNLDDLSASGFRTDYQYNLLDNLTGVQQGSQNSRTYTYDSFGRRITESYPEIQGLAVSYTYDNAGNLLTRTRPGPNQTSPTTSITTTYSSDALGRVLSTQYDDGVTPATHQYYDETSIWGRSGSYGSGRLTSTVVDGPYANGSIFIYDAAGNITENAQKPPRSWSGDGYSISYGYDAAGKITSLSNGAVGSSHTFGYNIAKQLTEINATAPNGPNFPPTLISNVDNQAFGLASATLGNGATRQVSYTPWGAISHSQDTIVAAVPAAKSHGWVDIQGSVRTTTIDTGTSGSATFYIASGSGPRSQQFCTPTCYTVPNAGGIGIQIYGAGGVIGTASTSYSETSSLSDIASSLISNLQGPVRATVNGNAITITATSKGSSTNYGVTSTVAWNTQYFSSPFVVVSPANFGLSGGSDGTIQTVYDAGSVSVSIAGITKTASYYPGRTRELIAQDIANQFNYSGSPVTATVTGYRIDFWSTALSASANYTLLASSATYQPSNFTGSSFTTTASGAQMSGGTDASPNGTKTLYSIDVNYGNYGRIKSVNDSITGYRSYTYDEFNHLKTGSAGGGDWSWGYDFVGNRWNQYGTWTYVEPGLGFDFATNRGYGASYDVLGNIINDGQHSYTYDAENRIIAVDGGTTAKYAYNANGLRIRKETTAGVSEYLYDLQDHVITEIGPSGSWARAEIYSDIGHVATYTPAGTYFAHADWQGTDRVRTDAAGNPVTTCTTFTYGDGRTCTGLNVSPVAFTGYEYDDESGLYYANHRYYNSRLGRFMSVDELEGDPSNPQSLNRYTYVLGDPVNLVDPSGQVGEGVGLCATNPVLCTIGIIGAIGDFLHFFHHHKPPFLGSLHPRPGLTDIGNFPNGESLGIPAGMSLPSQTIWQVIGPIGSGCEYGPCVPIGNGFGPALVLAGGAGETVCVIAEPCGAGEVIVAGVAIGAIAVGHRFWPQISASLTKITHAAISAAEAWNQYIRDLKACTDAYPPGPERDRCYQAAKARRDFSLNPGTGPKQ